MLKWDVRVGWLVVAALVATAGCSSTTRSSVSPAPTVHVDYGAKYLALASPETAALDELDRVGIAKVVPTALLVRVIRVTSTFDSAILRVEWPGRSTMSDVRALADAEVTFSSDLSVVNAQNALTLPSYRTRISHDEQVVGAATNTVRIDLGLPAPKA